MIAWRRVNFASRCSGVLQRGCFSGGASLGRASAGVLHRGCFTGWMFGQAMLTTLAPRIWTDTRPKDSPELRRAVAPRPPLVRANIPGESERGRTGALHGWHTFRESPSVAWLACSAAVHSRRCEASASHARRLPLRQPLPSPEPPRERCGPRRPLGSPRRRREAAATSRQAPSPPPPPPAPARGRDSTQGRGWHCKCSMSPLVLK